MGDWYTVDPGSDELPNYLDQDAPYFYYRLTLVAGSDNNQSPGFASITVDWTDNTGIEDMSLFATTENDGVLHDWSVDGDTPASFRVLRGANDPVAVSGSLHAGRHAVFWGCSAEAAGVYLLRLETLDKSLSRPFVSPSGFFSSE